MSDKPSIHEALAAVMADVSHVGKGDTNTHFRFSFRGVDRIINAVGPVLRRHGVVGPFPELIDLQSRDVVTGQNKSTREVTVTVAYTFHGPAGDSLRCIVPGEAQDQGDKAVAKAMSVAYRTALIQALCIPTDQVDPDAQSYTRADRELQGWITKVKSAADEKGWSVDELAHDFFEWSQGEDIRAADADVLKEYHAHLVPPTKMRRAQ